MSMVVVLFTYVDGDGNCLNIALSGLSVGSYTFAADGPVSRRADSRYELWKDSLDVCVSGSDTSVRSLQADSTVVQRKSVYPVMNGVRDGVHVIIILNMSFIPRNRSDTPTEIIAAMLLL